jgi:hypothetical protein
MANPNANAEDASTSARDTLVMKYRYHINYGKSVPHSVEDGAVKGAGGDGASPLGWTQLGWWTQMDKKVLPCPGGAEPRGGGGGVDVRIEGRYTYDIYRYSRTRARAEALQRRAPPPLPPPQPPLRPPQNCTEKPTKRSVG